MEINSKMHSIIKESVWDAVMKYADKVVNGDYPEGKPNTIEEVIKGNGWVIYKTLEKTPSSAIIAVCTNPPMWRQEALSFEELVDDLNVYFEDKHLTTRAYPLDRDEYGYEGQGALISFKK